MTPKSRRWLALLALPLVLAAILGCPGIREDEFVCEDAVSHLQACCPGFSGNNVDCEYDPGGCEGARTVYPEITTRQAACIRGESCGELVASGVCARAIAAPPGTTWDEQGSLPVDDDADPPLPYPQVCP